MSMLFLKTGVAFALAALVLPAWSAGPASPAESKYQQEKARCEAGQSGQDRATCLKEAGAALQEARRGQLGAAATGNLEANRLARCEAQSGTDRDECITRMRAGTTTGSASSGGILRESVTPDTTKK